MTIGPVLANLLGPGQINPRIVGDNLVVDLVANNTIIEVGKVVGNVRGQQGIPGGLTTAQQLIFDTAISNVNTRLTDTLATAEAMFAQAAYGDVHVIRSEVEPPAWQLGPREVLWLPTPGIPLPASQTYEGLVAASMPTTYASFSGNVTDTGPAALPFVATSLTYVPGIGAGSQGVQLTSGSSRLSATPSGGVQGPFGFAGASSLALSVIVSPTASIASTTLFLQSGFVQIGTGTTGRIGAVITIGTARFEALSTATLNIGQPTHIGILWSGSELQLMIDGIPSGVVSTTTASMNAVTMNPIYVGSDAGGGSRFPGTIAGLEIHKNKTLTRADMTARARAVGAYKW